MELNDASPSCGRAAGLSQEQLGERLGVTRQGGLQMGVRADRTRRHHHLPAVPSAECVGGLCAAGQGA